MLDGLRRTNKARVERRRSFVFLHDLFALGENPLNCFAESCRARVCQDFRTPAQDVRSGLVFRRGASGTPPCLLPIATRAPFSEAPSRSVFRRSRCPSECQGRGRPVSFFGGHVGSDRFFLEWECSRTLGFGRSSLSWDLFRDDGAPNRTCVAWGPGQTQSSSPVQQRWRTNARVATAAVSEICLAVSRLCACAPRNATASNKPTTSSKLANRSWRCRSCLAADDCTEVAMVSSAHGLSDDRSSPILCRSVGMNVLCGRASARSTGSLAAFSISSSVFQNWQGPRQHSDSPTARRKIRSRLSRRTGPLGCARG